MFCRPNTACLGRHGPRRPSAHVGYFYFIDFIIDIPKRKTLIITLNRNQKFKKNAVPQSLKLLKKAINLYFDLEFFSKPTIRTKKPTPQNSKRNPMASIGIRLIFVTNIINIANNEQIRPIPERPKYRHLFSILWREIFLYRFGVGIF
jgi:hypothetical protein